MHIQNQSRFKQWISTLLIICCTFYFPGVAIGEKNNSGYSTPGEASQDGQFVHGAKRGAIMIRVHIIGAVSGQGIHFYREGTNILDAMLYAGGMGATTKLSDITIRRKGQAELIHVDLEALIEEGGEFPRIKDGDIVRVPWNWRRDIATITLVTGFIGSVTAFTLALIALAK